jgi:hypothetical protein
VTIFVSCDFVAALAAVLSTVDGQTDENVFELESKIIKEFNTTRHSSSFLAWVFAKSRSWLPRISFLKAANSIIWYFKCTSINDVERLKDAYFCGKLKCHLEEIATHLSEGRNRVSLHVEWKRDDYQSCRDHLKSHLARLFELCLVR